MSICEYLSEIWVVDESGYKTYDEAIRFHPNSSPKRIIYKDSAWPAPVVFDEYSNYSRPRNTETLRTVLDRCWASWRIKNGDFT